MDRRPLKTKTAIYQAFIALLRQEPYDSVTVQAICQRANVGRSTFYAHFDSKEMLLEYLCQDLFHHTFEQSERFNSLEDCLSHIFYHFKENQDKVATLLLNRNPYFMKRFKEECLSHVLPFFLDQLPDHKKTLEADYLNHMICSLIMDSLDWWLHQRQKMSESELVYHIMTMIT